jgi:hypothetical protein
MKNYSIRQASVSEAGILTSIAFQSKKTWNYPDHYLEIWKKELTISDDYIQANIVYCIEYQEVINGFYSLVFNPANQFFGEVFVEEGWWLDHMFILPEYHISEVNIFVDPNAVGFYEKMGAEKIRSSKSSIPGREIPVYRIKT